MSDGLPTEETAGGVPGSVRSSPALARRPAVGIVHCPPGTPSIDWRWARGLVVRRAHASRLHLLDVLEVRDLDALAPSAGDVGGGRLDSEVMRRRLEQLAAAAAASYPAPAVLLAEGVPPDFVAHVVAAHGLGVVDPMVAQRRQDSPETR